VVPNTILGVLALLSLVLLLWQWFVAIRFPLHRRAADPSFFPAVTLLKPLKGSDPTTEPSLRTWFTQDYSGPLQILFGVASADDSVCPIVRKLLAEFPSKDAQLIICGPLAGANAKVSKLIELEHLAKHEILIISDADVRVPPDFLPNLVVPFSEFSRRRDEAEPNAPRSRRPEQHESPEAAPHEADELRADPLSPSDGERARVRGSVLQQPDAHPHEANAASPPTTPSIENLKSKIQNPPSPSPLDPRHSPPTGLVNCFYLLANPSTPAMQWEAVAINADFWSQVLQAQSLKPIDFALGAVMATRKQQLAEIGGLAALADCLADDYQLGNRIARKGYRIALSTVPVECWSEPMNWTDVWKHQLRWARTIRVCQPLPYFFSILSNPTLWPLLWAALKPAPISLGFLLLCLFLRIVTASHLQHRLSTSRNTQHPPPTTFPPWLPPLKDLLQTAIWLLAFMGNRIEWRGQRMRLRRDGTLVKPEPPS
jgi:Glycosyl transferase family 21